MPTVKFRRICSFTILYEATSQSSNACSRELLLPNFEQVNKAFLFRFIQRLLLAVICFSQFVRSLSRFIVGIFQNCLGICVKNSYQQAIYVNLQVLNICLPLLYPRLLLQNEPNQVLEKKSTQFFNTIQSINRYSFNLRNPVLVDAPGYK